MTKIRFIGDVHGKIPEYLSILDDAAAKGIDQTVQVGDFGHGFTHIPVLSHTNRHIRGNHDDPALALAHPNCIKDGTIDEHGIMYVGGAWSIDWQYRRVGVDLWEAEELSYPELQNMIDTAIEKQPKIMVTHDCPASMIPRMFPFAMSGFRSRTQVALDTILRETNPQLWIMGHWHVAVDYQNPHYDHEQPNTRFICLPELSYMDIDV